VPLLIQALSTSHEDHQADAARALGELGAAAADALPALRKLADSDAHSHARYTAADAIDRIEAAMRPSP
jgi:HEAT repeat protein